MIRKLLVFAVIVIAAAAGCQRERNQTQSDTIAPATVPAASTTDSDPPITQTLVLEEDHARSEAEGGVLTDPRKPQAKPTTSTTTTGTTSTTSTRR